MHIRKQLIYAGIAVVAVFALTVALVRVNSDHTGDRTEEALQPPGKAIVGTLKHDTDPYDVLITYTDKGFNPAEVTIKRGQRVRFLDKAADGSWPASGIHPTHSLYPEKESTDCLGSSFDSCQKLSVDQFWDFTFNYTGEWRYHDHLQAYNTGMITVQ